jgi:Holliday junction resolvasome RuvABC endonuclease subunit
MRLIGMDPSLASFGLADVGYAGHGILVDDVRVIVTKPDRRRSKTEDTSRRARLIAAQLEEYLRGREERPTALCVEAVALVYGKTTLTTVSALGRIRGVVDAIAALWRLPLIEHTPQTLKLEVTGRQDAEKAEMVSTLESRFPYLKPLWPPGELREHAADAIAAVLASRYHPLLTRAARQAAEP